MKSVLAEITGEVIGTAILIVLGVGVVANTGLSPRLASSAYDWNTIVLGWSLAVLVAVYISGGVSGAHLNPAVTLSMAVRGSLPWKKTIWYIPAQLVGAFLGAWLVWIMYGEGLRAAGLPNVYTSGPGSVFAAAFSAKTGAVQAIAPYSIIAACITEVVSTALLLMTILAASDERNLGLKHNMGPFLVAAVVMAIGFSLSGPSGYSLNPARDLSPRLVAALTGVKDVFQGHYWYTAPVLAPIGGGFLGVFLYDKVMARFLNTPV